MAEIPIKMNDHHVTLDVSDYIPELSGDEVVCALQEVMPVFAELLQTQIIWKKLDQNLRDERIHAYLILDMLVRAHLTIAANRAHSGQKVILGVASLKEYGFPEFADDAEEID